MSVERNFALYFQACIKAIVFRNGQSGVSLFNSNFLDRRTLCQNNLNFREHHIYPLLFVLLFLGRDGIDLKRRLSIRARLFERNFDLRKDHIYPPRFIPLVRGRTRIDSLWFILLVRGLDGIDRLASGGRSRLFNRNFDLRKAHIYTLRFILLFRGRNRIDWLASARARLFKRKFDLRKDHIDPLRSIPLGRGRTRIDSLWFILLVRGQDTLDRLASGSRARLFERNRKDPIYPLRFNPLVRGRTRIDSLWFILLFLGRDRIDRLASGARAGLFERNRKDPIYPLRFIALVRGRTSNRRLVIGLEYYTCSSSCFFSGKCTKS